MFRTIVRTIKALAAGLVVAAALTTAASAQGVLEDCATDIASYCSGVEPGHGRVISCLYAHETSISEACFTATIDYHDAMDYLFGSLREALASCADDIRTHCEGTEFGHGRILTCLAESKSEIAPACQRVVDGFEFGMAAE